MKEKDSNIELFRIVATWGVPFILIVCAILNTFILMAVILLHH